MARTVKREEHNAKRSDILNAALKLIHAEGYAELSIQDILNELGISKGALYHYFDSKEAILDALVDRMTEEVDAAVQPVIRDPNLSAIRKLQGYLDVSAQWKRDRAAQTIPLLRAWYDEKNDLVRQRFVSRLVPRAARTIESIIRQGVTEGVFTARFPEEAATLLIQMSVGVSETVTKLMLSAVLSGRRGAPKKAETMVRAYVDAMERIVGAPPGCLKPPLIGKTPKQLRVIAAFHPPPVTARRPRRL